MKKNYLLISFFLLGSSIFAQDIVNGDFAINNGNDLSFVPGCIANGSNPTFSDTSVLNWVRSHGSPVVGDGFATGSIVVGAGYLANTPIHPSDGLVWGNGIMGNYNFERNVIYQVEVDLLRHSATEGAIYFYAAKDIARNLVMAMPGTPNCQSHIPTAGNKQEIGSITGASQTFTTHTLTFTCSSDGLDKFWICPIANNTGTGGNYVSSWVSAIRIKIVCRPQRVFSSGISPMPSGLHRYGRIFAGTSFGIGGGTRVRNNINAVTTFRAGEIIDIKNTFVAEVTNNNTFIAEIVDCDIIGNPPPPDFTLEVDRLENKEQSALLVFPNPAVKEITVRYQQPLDCGKTTFTITNSTGQILHTHVSDWESGGGEREQHFDISAFSPGTYFIQAWCGQFKEVAKFTVLP